MKTLDEVIKAIECCGNDESDSNCEECSYTGISCCFERDKDALHYLKAYQKIEDEYEELKDWWAEEHAENVPLTWDELEQMQGKPVWVEVDGEWWGRFWAFVEVANDSYINFFQKGQEYPEDLWKCNMGKTWNAFRKERE